MNVVESSLSQDIKRSWENIALLEERLFESGAEWIREIAIQGQRLIDLKAQLKHGEWLPWCDTQNVTYQRINRCMRVAANLSRVINLDSSSSLRRVLAICQANDDPEPDAKEPKRWPAYIEAHHRTSKLLAVFRKSPITQWPSEGVDQLKKDLLPIVTTLWPSGSFLE